MEEQHNDRLPDDFVSWLVDYDEALAAGAGGQVPKSQVPKSQVPKSSGF